MGTFEKEIIETLFDSGRPAGDLDLVGRSSLNCAITKLIYFS